MDPVFLIAQGAAAGATRILRRGQAGRLDPLGGLRAPRRSGKAGGGPCRRHPCRRDGCPLRPAPHRRSRGGRIPPSRDRPAAPLPSDDRAAGAAVRRLLGGRDRHGHVPRGGPGGPRARGTQGPRHGDASRAGRESGHTGGDRVPSPRRAGRRDRDERSAGVGRPGVHPGSPSEDRARPAGDRPQGPVHGRGGRRGDRPRNRGAMHRRRGHDPGPASSIFKARDPAEAARALAAVARQGGA